jgi:putative peptide zinc metalloprotease protein
MTPSSGTLAPSGPAPNLAARPTPPVPGEGEVRGAPPSPAVPHRAAGIELVGEMPGSGYRKAPLLVRRIDGQTVQLSPLLYVVLAAIDGRRSSHEIAALVSPVVERLVDPTDVEFLVDERLRPLGLVRGADGSEPEVQRANPLLALRCRFVISNPRVTRAVTRPFLPLFRPAVMLTMVAAFVAVTWWVLFDKGIGTAVHEAFYDPRLLLLVFGLTIASAAFHEIGHAAACRYGGASPGAMGGALYLVWPAFYTDVTDSYRLEKRGRLRVDVGGLYFNAIFAVGTFAAWSVTRSDALLLVIPGQVLQMVRQLVPLIRFDGYHILADLTGVPDLFSRIKPTLVGMWPTNWGSPEATVLKRWVRVVVTVWVLVVIPFLALMIVGMVLILPRVLATAWDSAGIQWENVQVAWGDWDLARATVGILSILAVSIPAVGMVYLLTRMVRRAARRVWRWTDGDPRKRAIAFAGAGVLLGAVAWVWWPNGQYEPISADERGTVTDVLRPLVEPAAASAPMEAADATAPVAVTPSALTPSLAPPTIAVAPTTAPAVVAPAGVIEATTTAPDPGDRSQGDTGPTADPRSHTPEVTDEPHEPPTTEPAGTDPVATDPVDPEPESPFPFNLPPPPSEGDNQVTLVNTEDGASLYEMAYALVWVTDEVMDNGNYAYAIASCTDCTTVAVAFQVLLSIVRVETVIPENVALAVNYNCANCVTHAIAVQLVLTLAAMPSDAALHELAIVWQELEVLRQQLPELSSGQIYARLLQIERALLQILLSDDVATGAAPAEASDSTASGPVTTGQDAATTTTSSTTVPQSTTTTEPAATSTTTTTTSIAPAAASEPTSTTTSTTAPTTTTTAPSTTTTTTAAPTTTVASEPATTTGGDGDPSQSEGTAPDDGSPTASDGDTAGS